MYGGSALWVRGFLEVPMLKSRLDIDSEGEKEDFVWDAEMVMSAKMS